MMFEVEDLVHASPATVSRCGMVFIEPSALGLLPIIEMWMNKIPHKLRLKKEVTTKLLELFNKYLEDTIAL